MLPFSEKKTHCSIRELDHFIGLVVSSFPAVKPVRLYYRELEVFKLDAVSANDDDYNSIICSSKKANAGLDWFILSGHLYNATSLKKPSTVSTLITDAFKAGWGVVCNGVSSSGLWSKTVLVLHIFTIWKEWFLVCMHCHNLLGSGALHAIVCWRHIICREALMSEQIICLSVIIRILSGNCILQCFYGSRKHCLFQK